MQNPTWQPHVGNESQKLLKIFEHSKNLPKEAAQKVMSTAASILAKGISPLQKKGNKTGLVVGYVQSGKTLSFTAVAAIARDNGFPMVIVITGIKNNLLDQSTQRLLEDLNVRDIPPEWIDFEEPKTSADLQMISEYLNDWKCEDISDQPTLLITIKKQHQALINLSNILSKLNVDFPVLIIDDEADQASLNTRVRQGLESPTYQRIIELKRTLPLHTYIQYTATPQAPLLINLIDTLSPSFVEVLEPGIGYVGGSDFFGHQRNGLVCHIPASDVPSNNNRMIDPPESLLKALRIFYLGAAAGRIEGRSPSNKNRSMLVHPSRTTYTHFEYYNAIKYVTTEWQKILSLKDTESNKLELIADLSQSYAELAQTVSDIPDFGSIIKQFPHVLRKTQIQEVNTRGRTKTPVIEWRKEYSWILAGGQALDRGFTIEGLTVTYMPRGVGTGNADTLQQRARFFGYKRKYLGYCRIFLESSTLGAFEAYVDHEEEMRSQLEQVSRNKGTLSDWKRLFVLDPGLSPCRKNVIEFDYARGNFADKWFFPKQALVPEEIATHNTNSIGTFINKNVFHETAIFATDIPSQKHIETTIPLEDVVSDLLLQYKIIDEDDTLNMTGVLLQLARAISQASEGGAVEMAKVFRMRPTMQGKRTVDANGKLGSQRALFQGRGKELGQKQSYPGDAAFRNAENFSLQIHFYDLMQNGKEIAKNVPIIAMWIPKRMGLSWIKQTQI